MQDNTWILLHIARKTGLFGEAVIATTRFSKEIGLSQQTVSRKINMLEQEGYLNKSAAKKGLHISLKEKGRKKLRSVQEIITPLFERKELTGKIVDGLGQGRFYTKLPGYMKQFEEKLHFKPYPGTLNMVSDEALIKEFIGQKKQVNIEGFKTRERTYGNIRVYEVDVYGKKAAIVIPERSSHPPEVFEVIAPFHIRRGLKLKAGEKLTIK